MQLEHLRYLLTTAQIGSINKASQELHLNQQQLSKIVQKIEQELDCQIFVRTARGIRPTENGQDVLTTIEKILKDYDALNQRIQTANLASKATLKGTLSLLTHITIWKDSRCFQILRQFSQHYPEITLHTNEQATGKIIHSVSKQEVDAGLILITERELKDDATLPDNVLFLPLSTLQLVLYTASSTAIAKKHKTTSLKQLLKEPLLVYQPYMGEETPVDAAFDGIGTPNIKYSLSNLNFFHNLLEQGAASYLGTQQERVLFDEHNLVAIPIRDKLPIYTGLLINKKNLDDPIIKAFSDFCIAHY